MPKLFTLKTNPNISKAYSMFALFAPELPSHWITKLRRMRNNETLNLIIRDLVERGKCRSKDDKMRKYCRKNEVSGRKTQRNQKSTWKPDTFRHSQRHFLIRREMCFKQPCFIDQKRKTPVIYRSEQKKPWFTDQSKKTPVIYRSEQKNTRDL